MIQFVAGGDMFAVGANILVNPVNCVGVMGAGLAREFKKRYPKMHEEYRAACKLGAVRLGDIWFWHHVEYGCAWIVCFPTKNHWQDKSQLYDIATGLRSLRDFLLSLPMTGNLHRVAIPALGCGLGGLSWESVKPLIVDELQVVFDADINVFEPY